MVQDASCGIENFSRNCRNFICQSEKSCGIQRRMTLRRYNTLPIGGAGNRVVNLGGDEFFVDSQEALDGILQAFSRRSHAFIP